MQRIYKITGELPTANEYIGACRTNRYKAASVKRSAETLITAQIHDRSPVQGRIFLRFEWHEPNQKRDKDNVAFAKKFVLDALQKCGVLPNDNNRYIAGFADDFVYGGERGVVVEITEADE